MEKNNQFFSGGQVARNNCEWHAPALLAGASVETTHCIQTKYILKYVGLDTFRYASTSLSLRSARRDYSTNGLLYETN
jgi:hypothetical protein